MGSRFVLLLLTGIVVAATAFAYFSPHEGSPYEVYVAGLAGLAAIIIAEIDEFRRIRARFDGSSRKRQLYLALALAPPIALLVLIGSIISMGASQATPVLIGFLIVAGFATGFRYWFVKKL